uniref:WW domain-containing protein n=1 Tax=Globisporangium ultimum (strain ATCC 200006 / CBS 805.95 / DAOM BR144) TaxID=431595 RepID=K3XBV3_GLOUD
MESIVGKRRRELTMMARPTSREQSDACSDDESWRRRGTIFPKCVVREAPLKAASVSKQLQQHASFTKQKLHREAETTRSQQNMKESVLKDLRLPGSEHTPNAAVTSVVAPPRSLSKPKQRHNHSNALPTPPKRLASIPKLSSASNNDHHAHSKKKKRKVPSNANQWTSVVAPIAWEQRGSSSEDTSQDGDDDERQINAGVYVLENTKTGHCYFGTTWDLKNAAAQIFFDLENGEHPHQALTRGFQLYGAAASGIRYRVLERVAIPAPHKSALSAQTASKEKPRGRLLHKTNETDSVDVRQIEALLHKRLQFHRRKRIRKRTLQLVRRLVLLPRLQRYWPRWQRLTQLEQAVEHDAAATELQRVVRGYLGTRHALHMRKSRAAIHLQGFLRVCVARSTLRKLRRANLEHKSAQIIQSGMRHFVERRKLERRRLVVKKWLQVRQIQTCYRGYRGRQVALQKRHQRQQHNACVDIQRVVRGRLGQKCAQRRRLFLRQSRAAACIQTRWRGVLTRAAFMERQAHRSAYQQLHDAAIKIQRVYARFLERKWSRVASKYAFHVQQATAIRAAYKNYVAKKFGWAAMTFALEMSMAVRIQRAARRWQFLHRMRNLVAEIRRDHAARLIQRIMRGTLARQRYLRLKRLHQESLAATHIQVVWQSHQFFTKLASIAAQWRHEKSARLIQSHYRRHHAHKVYLIVRNEARRQRAAIKLQCMYRTRKARCEWRRRVELRTQGACDDCGDAIATLYSFSAEMELCTSCWGSYNSELGPEKRRDLYDGLEPLGVHVYRRLKPIAVVLQRRYRQLQRRLITKYSVCPLCTQNAIRRHCEACGNKRFCHSCAALLHQLKKESQEHHEILTVEAFETRERAALRIQTQFRRFQQRRTLFELRHKLEDAAAQRVQRAYWTHRQRRITRALCATHAQQIRDERRSALVIQRYYRGHVARLERHQLTKQRRGAICIQKAVRGRQSRLEAQRLRQRRDAAIEIQRHARGMHARYLVSLKKKELWQRKQELAATTLQRHTRGFLVRHFLLKAKRNAAALRIQTVWRCAMARKELGRRRQVRAKQRREQEEAIARVKAAHKAEMERIAATRIQTQWRRYQVKGELHIRKLARARRLRATRHAQCFALETANAVVIQRFIRGKWIDAVSKSRLAVHCCARRYLSRRLLQRLRREKLAVIQIQRAFRHSRAKRKLTDLVGDAQSSDAAVLSPWVELFDEANGCVYYYNTETMQSSWEPPIAVDLQQNRDAWEPEWVEYWDENVGASYFYNVKTGEATWTTPDGMDALSKDSGYDAGLDNQAAALEYEQYPEYAGGGYQGAYHTLPPKMQTKSIRQSQVHGTNQEKELPQTMLQTAPLFSPNFASSSAGYESHAANNEQTAMPWTGENAYEYGWEEDATAVDTEYDINYKIFMTQLERDQQQQQEQQDESGDDLQQHERQQQHGHSKDPKDK